MKLTAFTIIAALVLATPGIAQPAPTVEPTPTAQPAAARLIDSSIESLVANPATKAVVDANFPGIEAHPAYEQFKGMSLVQVQPFSNGVITDEAIAKANSELAAIK